MNTTRLRLLGIVGSLALVSNAASAGGIDTFDAPVSGSDLLLTARGHSETGHMKPFGRLSLAYNNDPLIMRNADGSETGLINHQFGAYGAVGLALWKRLQLAALVPAYYQSGEAPAGGSAVSGMALGDVALNAQFAVLQRDDFLELGFASRVTVPTGNEKRFVGDGNLAATISGIVSRQFGEDGLLLTSSISGSLRSRTTAAEDGGSAVLLGLGVAVPIASKLALTCEGALATELNHFLGETATPASMLAGARYGFAGWLAHLGAGPGLTRGVGTPDFRMLAMIGTDVEVPAEPPPPDPAVDAAARPRADKDGDRVDDARDACPAQAEDKDGVSDEDGCPDLDDDKDGVPDATDKCLTEAEDKDGFEDENGCPELDNDKDELLDAADKCPAEAEDEDGCPELDNDQDTVLDATDKCPAEAESKNGVDDEDGCPDLLRVEQEQIRTLEPIYFERGSERLQARSLPLVQELASVIASRSDLGMISIEGHTDNAGRETSNLELSQKRAESIRKILIENGVPAARLLATGYGEMRPIASNESAQGREQNRRVEFRLAGAMPQQGK